MKGEIALFDDDDDACLAVPSLVVELSRLLLWFLGTRSVVRCWVGEYVLGDRGLGEGLLSPRLISCHFFGARETD